MICKIMSGFARFPAPFRGLRHGGGQGWQALLARAGTGPPRKDDQLALQDAARLTGFHVHEELQVVPEDFADRLLIVEAIEAAGDEILEQIADAAALERRVVDQAPPEIDIHAHGHRFRRHSSAERRSPRRLRGHVLHGSTECLQKPSCSHKHIANVLTMGDKSPTEASSTFGWNRWLSAGDTLVPGGAVDA